MHSSGVGPLEEERAPPSPFFPAAAAVAAAASAGVESLRTMMPKTTLGRGGDVLGDAAAPAPPAAAAPPFAPIAPPNAADADLFTPPSAPAPAAPAAPAAREDEAKGEEVEEDEEKGEEEPPLSWLGNGVASWRENTLLGGAGTLTRV